MRVIEVLFLFILIYLSALRWTGLKLFFKTAIRNLLLLSNFL